MPELTTFISDYGNVPAGVVAVYFVMKGVLKSLDYRISRIEKKLEDFSERATPRSREQFARLQVEIDHLKDNHGHHQNT